MIEDIETFTGVRLGPGTLYGAIARLEKNELIEPVETSDRRRPYRLTPAGKKFLEESLVQLEKITKTGFQRLAIL
ncbi:Transcriptional regulator PadR-like family protein [Thermoflavimicrobium dichotomicum]|uniref:Transcriptional regulator PadR-like family protein n=2 Tax=Thermoflavimicrobium dichotomicum TaxID=46223 RepID=A0A1I3UXP4_9BACL|nr:Transcriptional regulator PadR-like family protein [Thermoflavimicrobium dichotomicum]